MAGMHGAGPQLPFPQALPFWLKDVTADQEPRFWRGASEM